MTPRAEPLVLTEFETSPPVRLTASDLRLLHSLPKDRIAVGATADPEHVVLRATQWVGSIKLPSLTVRVMPKVDDLRNVVMMMTVASGLTDWSAEQVGYGMDDLVEGVAEIALRAIDAVTRRGLVHGYREEEGRLQGIRGRLLVNELARRPWEVAPVPCRYDEFTADIRENRVFRACVEEIGRWPLGPGPRSHARTLQARLEGIQQSAHPLHDLDLVRPTPVNEHYGPALELCRLIFDALAVLHAPGEVIADAFLVNMNALYEAWIGAELARRLWPDVEVLEQHPVPLSHKPLVGMKPDLVFKRGHSVAYVADVKYKLTGTGISRTSDYYQLLAYATALELPAGTLIYCRADEAPPRDITVAGGGQRLRCHPLGLGGSWQDVSRRLDALAEELHRECRGHTLTPA